MRRRVFVAVAAIFAANGFVIGAWAVRVVAIQRSHGLGDSGLGAALVCVGLGALVAMPPTGELATRFGSVVCVRVGVVVLALAPVLAAVSGSIPLLLVGLAALGAGNGGLDIAMNTQGVALERLLGRPVMSTLHAVYSGGFLLSALVGGLVASAGVGTTAHLAGTAALAVGCVLATSPWLVGDRPDEEAIVGLSWPSRRLLVLGLIGFCALMTEGAINDWGSIYIERVLDSSPALAGVAFACFGVGMASSRAVGDFVRSRLGAVRLVAVGATVSAAALAAALAVGSPAVLVAAFLLVGLGLGNCFPVALAAAGLIGARRGGDAAAVASVSTLGYLGFLLGPAAIGLLSGATSLTVGLLLLVAALAVVVGLAAAVRPADPRDGRF